MKISVDAKLSEELQALANMLSGKGKELLLRAAGVELQVTTAEHLRQVALSRHATANRLGASPSNHFAAASDKVSADSALEVSGEKAVLSINHPGISRAFRDLTIVPRGSKALALPLVREAYNRRPAQFPRDKFFVFTSKTTGNSFLALRQPNKNAKPILYYILKRSVHQSQDRTLLPSDATWQAAAAKGMGNELQRIMQQTVKG